jgi:hypothetical protein
MKAVDWWMTTMTWLPNRQRFADIILTARRSQAAGHLLYRCKEERWALLLYVRGEALGLHLSEKNCPTIILRPENLPSELREAFTKELEPDGQAGGAEEDSESAEEGDGVVDEVEAGSR